MIGARGKIGISGLVPLAFLPLALAGDDEFDWERDRIVLQNGKEHRGVVIDACRDDEVVLLLDGGKREEFARAKVQHVDMLRDRLKGFLEKHQPGLPVEVEWQKVLDAESARMRHMARIQAYRVLALDPEHAQAHEFLGHKRTGGDFAWRIDGKSVAAKKFAAMSREWNSRLVLESEHFVVETDAGLERGLDVVFDLERLYLWWMEHLGKALHATEDVDDPRTEKVTFLVHKNLASFQPLSRKEPLYDPFGQETTKKGGINVARTFYEPDAPRPKELFELGTEALIYSTLVLGKKQGTTEDDPRIQRSAHWLELGLAYWVARHCGGPPGFATIEAPFTGTFRLDFETARRTLEKVGPAHVLNDARNELKNLIGLSYDNFVGSSGNIPLVKARCASFVSFLVEADPVPKGKNVVRGGREALWHYFREVYGTPRAHASDAFDAGFGKKVKAEVLEVPWKAWVTPFSSVLTK